MSFKNVTEKLQFIDSTILARKIHGRLADVEQTVEMT
jgi:hypothetical protein